MERTLEIRRLRLLRLVAGLVVALGFLSLVPVSRGFSEWTRRMVGSVLCRAEAAGRLMVIAQARLMLAQAGCTASHARFSDAITRALAMSEPDVSLAECHARLRALRAVLNHLPRHAARLLRRIGRPAKDAVEHPRLATVRSVSLRPWHLAVPRIERPPDSDMAAIAFDFFPPSGIRSGGAGG